MRAESRPAHRGPRRFPDKAVPAVLLEPLDQVSLAEASAVPGLAEAAAALEEEVRVSEAAEAAVVDLVTGLPSSAIAAMPGAARSRDRFSTACVIRRWMPRLFRSMARPTPKPLIPRTVSGSLWAG